MKNYISLFYLILICSIIVKEVKSSENFIIAKIDQKIITNFDIKNKILGTLVIAGDEINQQNINNLKKEVLESLIILRLKEIELEKYNFKVSNQNINSFINQLSGNQRDKLKNKYKINNLDYNSLVKEVETELKWRQFIYQSYSKKIKIDEKTLENEIKKIIKLSKIDNNNFEVNLSEIVVYQNNNSNNEIISKIIKEIETNGFGNAALKFSISSSSAEKGKLGWINTKALSKNIENIVKKLKINQISEPIIETNSILFLKLNNKRSLNNQIDVKKLKSDLIQQKQNEMFNLYSRSHLSKLKNNSFIEYK
tara:strand:+ start:955 stop:1884 length:930 start_codon:yes stop_codon:yes gene_type:complete